MDPNSSIADPARPETRLPLPRGYALSGRLILSAIVVLFSIVLVILFVHLFVRCHVYLRRRRNSRRRLRNSGVPSSASSSAAAPRGLDPAVLSSLSIQIYADEDAAADVAECAVCLCDFEEGEKVRVLPRCGHCFHVGCIDLWFGSHNSCPLCRCAVEIESPETATEAVTGQQCLDPYRSIGSSSSSSAIPEVSIEIDGDRGELGLGFGSEGTDKNRILAIARFLSRGLRLSRVELDLERGESPLPPPPSAAAAE